MKQTTWKEQVAVTAFKHHDTKRQKLISFSKFVNIMHRRKKRVSPQIPHR